MNHGKVYKIVVCILTLLPGIILSKALSNPKSVNANLRAFLLDKDDWKVQPPRPEVYLPIYVSSAFFLVCAVVLMIKTWGSDPNSVPGKFENPLRNLNVIILAVILTTTSLQLALPAALVPGLLFPHFGLGLGQTVILVTILLWNCEVRRYCRRKAVAWLGEVLGETGTQGEQLAGVGGWMVEVVELEQRVGIGGRVGVEMEG